MKRAVLLAVLSGLSVSAAAQPVAKQGDVMLSATGMITGTSCRIMLVAHNTTNATLDHLYLAGELVADRTSVLVEYRLELVGPGLRRLEFAFVPAPLCTGSMRLVIRRALDCAFDGRPMTRCHAYLGTYRADPPGNGLRAVQVEIGIPADRPSP